jgi:hypothetical protein
MFSFDLLEFCLATVVYTVILLVLMRLGWYKKQVLKGLAKNQFNTYSTIVLLGTLCIVYRDDLVTLINDPPDYAFYTAVFLAILAYTLNSYKERLEVNRVFTQDQTTLLKNQGSLIQKQIELMESDIDNLKTDVAELKTDVAELKINVAKIPDLITSNNSTLLELFNNLLDQRNLAK